MLSNIMNDVRYALRTLRLNPVFSVTAILTIALGIGINTGIFSVLNGLALRDPRIPDAKNLVAIHQIVQGDWGRSIHGSGSMFSTAEFMDYRKSARTLDGI